MSVELELLRAWWQPVINQIVSNLNTMTATDYKGRTSNRFASGNTAQEITAKNTDITSETLTEYIITLTFPRYSLYIDEGVQGYENKAKTTGEFSFKRNGKNIPRAAMRSFMYNRGIVPRNDKGDRTKPKNMDEALNNIAFLIGKKIKRDGVDMVPFISSVINEDLIAKYKRYVVTIFGDRVKSEILIELDNIPT